MTRNEKTEAAPAISMTVAEYQDELASLFSWELPVEMVDLDAAVGRHLAENIVSVIDIPAFTNSAMDGYALRWRDVDPAHSGGIDNPELAVVAQIAAGDKDNPSLLPGSCVRIMTGAPIPTGADTIVPLENTDHDNDLMRITSWAGIHQGSYVRPAGQDCQAGTQIAAAGQRITPEMLAALIAAGHHHAPCRRPPRIAVVSTGAELITPGQPLRTGQVHDVNSHYLTTALRRDGVAVNEIRLIGDDPRLLADALDELSHQCDVALISGGISVGDYDVARIVLSTKAIRYGWRRVAMQPGKPQGWGCWRHDTVVIAMPGNPLSVVVSYQVLMRPIMLRQLGATPAATWRAQAAAEWSSPAGRQQYLPVTVSTTLTGQVEVRPAHHRGSASHIVTSLVSANALAVVPAEVTHVSCGDMVDVMLLSD